MSTAEEEKPKGPGMLKGEDEYKVTTPRLGSERAGHVEIILGPMFSGKTSELIRRIRRYMVAKYDCLVIKYSRDTRYTADDKAATHDKTTIQARPCASLNEVVDYAARFDVIGI